MIKIATTLVLLLSLSTIVSPQSKSSSRSWLNGTWEGTGYQTDTNETWAMVLTVRGGRYGIEYPSLKCGGRWIPISINSSRTTFVEKLTFGIDICADKGNVFIERLNPRQIAYRYSNRGTREITASAILNRKK